MLIKFSEKIYYTKHRYMFLEPAIGYIKGSNFSLMIDTGNSKAQIDQFFKELEEHDLPKPSYAILTHYHWDHSFGGAYIDMPIISTAKTREYLSEMSTWDWDDESIEKRISEKKEISYSADILKKVYGTQRDIKIKVPDMYKMGDLTLNLGNEKVTCFCNDNSHSDDAFLIYVHGEKVLFLGDSHSKNYYTTPMSFNKDKLLSYIKKLESIDFNYAIPGHGNIFTKAELLETMNEEYSKIEG